MLEPVFNGVEAMHQVGLVHRGICPANIRIMDNGRARLTGYATVGLRTAGSGLHEQLYEGYSAPEQYSTAEFEGRYTDEYSLAAVFYRMVCGVSPVPAAQRLEVIRRAQPHLDALRHRYLRSSRCCSHLLAVVGRESSLCHTGSSSSPMTALRPTGGGRSHASPPSPLGYTLAGAAPALV